MKVLGHVYATGTAVLLDEQGNVWLYQMPNATAPQLRGFHHTAAIIVKAGDLAAIEKELHLEDMYMIAEHDLIERDYPSCEENDVCESDHYSSESESLGVIKAFCDGINEEPVRSR